MPAVSLALDLMGGDFGPPVIIEGLRIALGRAANSFTAVLCGESSAIRMLFTESELEQYIDSGTLSIEACHQKLTVTDSPSQAWKQKPQSSTIRCISLQKEGRVDASISAAHSGILMVASMFLLGKEPGVIRPALAATMPTIKGKPLLLLDVGSNLDCKPEHLVCFSELGKTFMSRHHELRAPKIALLNIGVEPGKGNKLTRETDKLLKEKCPEYVGFIEGSRVLSGDVDIAICDGFSGNVFLKTCEGFYSLIQMSLGNNSLLRDAMKHSMSFLNAEQYGAVPFLGIHGVVLKAHGNSSATAIANAIERTVSVAQRSIAPLPSTGLKGLQNV